MKRIVEEELRDGSKRYVVQTNKILGIIPWKWHTVSYPTNEWGDMCHAVFKELKDAEKVLSNGKLDLPKDIIKRNIIIREY